jgi:hypothetical protein
MRGFRGELIPDIAKEHQVGGGNQHGSLAGTGGQEIRRIMRARRRVCQCKICKRAAREGVFFSDSRRPQRPACGTAFTLSMQKTHWRELYFSDYDNDRF